jgi:hypothetical protein
MTIAEKITVVILLVTIFAIVAGPIWAVRIAGSIEKKREFSRRKYNILAALMRTRKTYMHADHVWALNLVQLEFSENDKVISAHKAYIANLAEAVPDPGNDLDNLVSRRRDQFFDLLYEITKVVGITADKSDLARLAYVPYGWETEAEELRSFRQSMLEVLQGRRPLPITTFNPTPISKFPEQPV